MKVTAKTITNAQIARMRTLDHHASSLWLREYQIALGEELPYPSLADIVWAISYIPIIGSMVLQYRALGTGLSIPKS